jgi:hypothetical protein
MNERFLCHTRPLQGIVEAFTSSSHSLGQCIQRMNISWGAGNKAYAAVTL